MGWAIGRTMVMNEPDKARAKALAKLHELARLDDPEAAIVPVLIDAICMVEAYRGARHPFTHLPELTNSVDTLVRELNLQERVEAMAAE